MTKPAGLCKDPLSLLLATLVALSLLGAWLYAEESPGLDYYVAWVAADAVKNDTPLNIYDPAARYTLAVQYRNKADELQDVPRQKQIAAHRKELPMTATPFLYWVTGMLAGGNYEHDLSTWQLLSILLVTAAMLVTCRLLGYGAATSLAVLLPVLVWYTPFYSDIRVSNVNGFQLGLIGLILWLQSRDRDQRFLFAAGLVTGLLVMFKPNLAPVALLFVGGRLVRGQTRKLAIALAGVVTGAAAAVLVSSFWLGSATAWLDWLDLIRTVVDGGPGESGGNYPVITQITGSVGPLGQLATAVLLCLLCLAFFWWGRRRTAIAADRAALLQRERLENICLVALGCIVAMLASTLVWLHYYLLTLPMLLFALRPWREPGRMKVMPFVMLRVLPVALLVMLMETALQAVVGADGRSYWNMATMTNAVSLYVIGLWQFARGFSAEPDPQADAAPASG